MWPYKIDNEWLDFFNLFADYEHPAEEYEIAFVQYCVDMIEIEKQEGQNLRADEKIEKLSVSEIQRIYDIIQRVSKLNLEIFKDNCGLEGLLHFSWTESDVKSKLAHKTDDNFFNANLDKRGAFWELGYEKHDRMLYHVMQNVLINKKYKRELKDDVLLWCFITTLDWKVDFQNEYLRPIKILLNNNPIENHIAWQECPKKGLYIHYSKYSACAVPQYYGEHISLEDFIKETINSIYN
ncbi:MAG: hypothetical protein LUD77_04335, partial [Clostridiales bacterium]|nr:hypothetical protein [Clostridiales bacterium]